MAAKQTISIFSLILTLMIVPAALSVPAYAGCIEDRDWPEKPCLDTPPYSESYLRQVWAPYYDYKGSEWMEMKKGEMEQAAEEGKLKEWRQDQSEPDNFANENVYRYHQVFDGAPIVVTENSDIVDESKVPVQSYSNLIGWAAIAVVGIAGIFAAIFTFKKTRN